VSVRENFHEQFHLNTKMRQLLKLSMKFRCFLVAKVEGQWCDISLRIYVFSACCLDCCKRSGCAEICTVFKISVLNTRLDFLNIS
jgi:hypothetical protein